jgi:hypothetical protein
MEKQRRSLTASEQRWTFWLAVLCSVANVLSLIDKILAQVTSLVEWGR